MPYIKLQTQEALGAQRRIHKKVTSKHIIIKLIKKNNDKGTVITVIREKKKKKTITFKGAAIGLTS